MGSALDHPLTGYVILPAAGAAVGALTHPLQALLHRAMSTPQDHEQHPWKLRHSTLLGAGVGLGQAASRHLGHAVSQHMQHLHHRKHVAWRTPVAARRFVELLVKQLRAAKQPCRQRCSTASRASRQ